MKPENPDGMTPLTSEELADLIPVTIQTREQLNHWEQVNIQEAVKWAFSRSRKHADLATNKFMTGLHKRMFDQVWKWAGRFRTSNKNIGVDREFIQIELRNLHDDFKVWVEYSSYPVDEIAARFHHRLVFIHPFPNGNGRHARLMADLILKSLGGERFTWGGGGDLVSVNELRRRYIEALMAADGHDYGLLLEFVRS
jgi:Fic-DOC domain mobile mystery protein B